MVTKPKDSKATPATPESKAKDKPKARSAPKVQPANQCLCGCGGTTKSRFLPGHDARLKGILSRLEKERPREGDAVPAEALKYAKANPKGKVVAFYEGADVLRIAAQAQQEKK